MALGECAAADRRGTRGGHPQPDRDIRVLYLDGAPAGFFDIKPHLPDEVELAYFGMMEHATGQGHRPLVPGCGDRGGVVDGPQRVSVQTCTLDHPAALPLYQKLGFSPVGAEAGDGAAAAVRRASASVMRP